MHGRETPRNAPKRPEAPRNGFGVKIRGRPQPRRSRYQAGGKAEKSMFVRNEPKSGGGIVFA